MIEIILVQGFCPLKIKTTQFSNGCYRNSRAPALEMRVSVFLCKFEFVSNPYTVIICAMLFFLVFLSKSLGCEFFRDFKDNEYIADGLHFNWQQVNLTDVIGIWSHVF